MVDYDAVVDRCSVWRGKNPTTDKGEAEPFTGPHVPVRAIQREATRLSEPTARTRTTRAVRFMRSVVKEALLFWSRATPRHPSQGSQSLSCCLSLCTGVYRRRAKIRDMDEVGIHIRCQRCGTQMEMRDPAPGGVWRPEQFWVCVKCGRHFWTTYPPPTAAKPKAPAPAE